MFEAKGAMGRIGGRELALDVAGLDDFPRDFFFFFFLLRIFLMLFLPLSICFLVILFWFRSNIPRNEVTAVINASITVCYLGI